MRTRVNYRKTGRGRYFGRHGKFYVFIYVREHGKWDGFDRYVKWYTARIGKDGEWLMGEGAHGSSLPTLKKAKQWVVKMLKK